MTFGPSLPNIERPTLKQCRQKIAPDLTDLSVISCERIRASGNREKGEEILLDVLNHVKICNCNVEYRDTDRKALHENFKLMA